MPFLLFSLIALSVSFQKSARNETAFHCHQVDFSKSIEMEGILVTVSDQKFRLMNGRFLGGFSNGSTMPETYVTLGGAITPGRNYKVIFKGRCVSPKQNPSALYEIDHPRLVGKILTAHPLVNNLSLWQVIYRMREILWDRIELRLGKFPQVKAFSRAAWFGDTGRLGESFKTAVREFGLQHCLALSGQHVVILLLLFRIFPGRLKIASQLITACSLMVTSLFTPSIVRVVAILILFQLTRNRLIFVPGKRLLLVSGTLSVLIDSRLIGEPGFWLSCLGMWSLMSGYGVLRSLFIPIAMMPPLLFIFGRVSLLSPIASLIFGLIWDVVCLPIAFAAPCLPRFCDAALLQIESFISYIEVNLQTHPLGNWEQAVFRPNLIESIALFVLILEVCRRMTLWLNNYRSQPLFFL